MVRSEALRDRIAAGILDAAATVFAERGETASMTEIAEAAGVGRATLYRYFPTREALMRGLTDLAVDELVSRVADAELETVPVREGIARLARGFMTAGSRYGVIAQARKDKLTDADELDRKLAGPVRELLERGVADGTLRADVPVEIQFEMFTGLLERVLRLVAAGRIGTEQAGAAITAVFLDGTAAR
jgi:AcrR family transcriptional regulator